MTNVKVRILKWEGAELFKFYNMQYQNSFLRQYRPSGDKVDGIKRKIWVNLTSLRMNRYRNQCIKNYKAICP